MNVHDDRAATAPLAFVIAGALIIGVIATALMTTNDIATPSNTGASVSANRQAQASGLAEMLLETPGYSAGGNEWHATDIQFSDGRELGELGAGGRLGLRHAEVPYLDLTKFRNLKSAPLQEEDPSDPDGYANYVDVRESLGLEDEGLDFHIRAYPTLQSVQDRFNCVPVDSCKDPNLRVTYIGNLMEPVTAPTITDATCKKSPASDGSWRFEVRVENTGGTSTQFQGVFDLDFGDEEISRKDQSGIVPGGVGATTLLWVDVENQDFITCDATTTMTVHVYDPARRLTAPNVPPFSGMSPVSSPSVEAGQEFYAELDRMNYATGDPVQVGFTGVTGGEEVHWEVQGISSGAVVDCFFTPDDCKGVYTLQNKNDRFEINGLDEGTYLLKVTHPDGIVTTQRILVANTVGNYDNTGAAQFDEAMRIEVDFLRQLVKNFCPAHFDEADKSVLEEGPDPEVWEQQNWDDDCAGDRLAATVLDTNGNGQGQQWGDVFWDEKSLMTDHLCKRLQKVHTNGNCQSGNEARLDITNVLVVGSNVDHDSMTSGGFKWPLQAWVEAGGTVIVFGSPQTSTQWLQPIFHVGEESSSGGISAPDVTHPILAVPNQLDFTSYDNAGKIWRYTGGAEDLFTNVVNQGDDPITAINDPGTFGLGTVMISTWTPYDLYDGAGGLEGAAILDNFLTHAYRDMFLDYGPAIPAGQEAIPALGRSQICHTTNPDILENPVELRRCDHADLDGLGLIDMDIAVFVFRG